MDQLDLHLKNELKKMLAANGNLIEAVDAFNANSDPDNQSGMIALILESLREPSEANFWEKGVETNKALLEILRNIKSAGCEVERPLENYCSLIHKAVGVRDEKGDLLPVVREHLMMDVGSTTATCKRRSYPSKEIPLTSWRRSL